MIGLVVATWITILAALVSGALMEYAGIPPVIPFWISFIIAFGISIWNKEYQNHCSCPDCNMFTLTAGMLFLISVVVTLMYVVHWMVG